MSHTNETTNDASIQNIMKNLNKKIEAWKDIVIISRTHGQPATPTTFGKELRVFTYRIQKQLNMLDNT